MLLHMRNTNAYNKWLKGKYLRKNRKWVKKKKSLKRIINAEKKEQFH